MAELKQIIKLTQEQYDTLASGGTIGEYTGLSPNYIYLVPDNKELVLETDLSIGSSSSWTQLSDEDASKLEVISSTLRVPDKIHFTGDFDTVSSVLSYVFDAPIKGINYISFFYGQSNRKVIIGYNYVDQKWKFKYE